MKRFPKPCLDCGILTDGGTRCYKHQQQLDMVQGARRAGVKAATGQYSGDYQRRAKHIRQTATICHICKDGARWGDPWQADHLIPADPTSPLAPAHRSCNARRGNKPLDQHQTPPGEPRG